MQEPVHDNGVSEVLGDGGDSEETTEEAGRDDMFVDCPDELVSNAEKEAVVAVIAISDRGIGWCISRNRECGAGWLCDGDFVSCLVPIITLVQRTNGWVID